MSRAPQGWVLLMCLMALAIVSGMSVAAWRHANGHTQTAAHAAGRAQARWAAEAQLKAAESALLGGEPTPAGAQWHSALSSDLGWSSPHWRLHRLEVRVKQGPYQVRLQSVWLQSLLPEGPQPSAPRWRRLSWREVWT